MNGQEKKRFKLYKSGKKWVVATILSGGIVLGLGLGNEVQAQVMATQPDVATTNQVTNAESVVTETTSAVAQTATSVAANHSSQLSDVSASQAASSASKQTSTVSAASQGQAESAQNSVVAESNDVASTEAESTATSQATVTNLGDADDATVKSAQAAAETTYAATGTPQIITRAQAVGTQSDTPAVIDNGWHTDAGTSYFYQAGQKANGYLSDGHNWYLFKDGLRQSDVQQLDGTYYYFDHDTYLKRTNAYLQSRWGDYYLFGNNGQIQTDVQKWAGTYYYFD